MSASFSDIKDNIRFIATILILGVVAVSVSGCLFGGNSTPFSANTAPRSKAEREADEAAQKLAAATQRKLDQKIDEEHAERKEAARTRNRALHRKLAEQRRARSRAASLARKEKLKNRRTASSKRRASKKNRRSARSRHAERKRKSRKERHARNMALRRARLSRFRKKTPEVTVESDGGGGGGGH